MNPGGLLAVPGQVPVGSTGLRTHAPARPTGILLEVAGLVGSDLICLYYLNCGPLGWHPYNILILGICIPIALDHESRRMNSHHPQWASM